MDGLNLEVPSDVEAPGPRLTLDGRIRGDSRDAYLADWPLERVKLQYQLENEALTKGIQRYRKKNDRPGETGAEQALVSKYAEAMARALDAWTLDVLAGQSQLYGDVALLIRSFKDPLTLPVLAMRAAIGICSQQGRRGAPLVGLANTVAAHAVATLAAYDLRREAPRVYRSVQKITNRRNTDRERVAVLRKEGKAVGCKAVLWGNSQRIRMGMLLLTLLEQSTGLIRQEVIKERYAKSVRVVVLTEAAVDYLHNAHARGEMLHPINMPMVVPPRPWQGATGGGYLTGKRCVIKRVSEGRARMALARVTPEFWASINALQNTRWQVNTAVLEVMEKAWFERRGEFAKLPKADKEPLPERPAHIPAEATREDPEVRAWIRQLARAHDRNVALVAEQVFYIQALTEARRLADIGGPLFMPYEMDFRGRMYAVPAFLNPQGNKAIRALLTFYEAKPLGDSGAYWLAVHIANSYGVDKVSFDERVEWVEKNHWSIVATALDPFAHRQFMEAADQPWLFLAGALEWLGLHNHVEAGGRTQDYLSRLPVGMDGTCNGLQQFAAMVRDENTGRLLGLVPQDKPADIYSEVARAASEVIAKDAAEGNPVARRWVGKLTRKLVKRNTMTTPYSVTAYGMRDQMYHALGEAVKDGILDFDPQWADAVYLASVNAKVIPAVVGAADKVMGFLKECAKVSSQANKPVSWLTPVGLKVTQAYLREKVGVTEVDLLGRRYQLKFREKLKKLDTRGNALGVSPNFVHSLDASHLVATLVYCLDDGMDAFQMIHDSFGTHAGCVEQLNQRLREAFVDLYDQDVLANFRQEVAAQVGPTVAAKLPAVPQYGSLDISQVIHSPYFFA